MLGCGTGAGRTPRSSGSRRVRVHGSTAGHSGTHLLPSGVSSASGPQVISPSVCMARPHISTPRLLSTCPQRTSSLDHLSSCVRRRSITINLRPHLVPRPQPTHPRLVPILGFRDIMPLRRRRPHPLSPLFPYPAHFGRAPPSNPPPAHAARRRAPCTPCARRLLR